MKICTLELDLMKFNAELGIHASLPQSVIIAAIRVYFCFCLDGFLKKEVVRSQWITCDNARRIVRSFLNENEVVVIFLTRIIFIFVFASSVYSRSFSLSRTLPIRKEACLNTYVLHQIDNEPSN